LPKHGHQYSGKPDSNIRRYAAGFDFTRRDVDAARAQFLDELSWLEEAGRRMIDTSSLAPEDAALPKTIDQLQDRLLHREWQYYDGMHVVLKPRRGSAYDLQMAIMKGMERFYSLKRVLGSWRRGFHGEWLSYDDLARTLVPYVLSDRSYSAIVARSAVS
jgi:hypothetical protein